MTTTSTVRALSSLGRRGLSRDDSPRRRRLASAYWRCQDHQPTHLLHLGVRQFVVTSCWSLVCTIDGMGNSGTSDYRARRRAQEQQRRRQAQRAQRKEARSAAPDAGVDGRARRAAATTCGWCGGRITPHSRGPIPKWCSSACRHRAWEQARAAASGRAAVQVVERRVEVPTRQPLARRDWPQALRELAQQLDDGRIYDRDLPGLSMALNAVLEAYKRRPNVRPSATDRYRATWSSPHGSQ